MRAVCAYKQSTLLRVSLRRESFRRCLRTIADFGDATRHLRAKWILVKQSMEILVSFRNTYSIQGGTEPFSKLVF